MIHVYAFAEELDELPGSAGLDGAPLERRSFEDVSAVFSRRSGVSSRETLRGDALVHGAIVEALMPCASAVVPVRFGEVVEDEGALDATLTARLAALRRTFGSIRDCVEISLRVWDGPAAAESRPASGADYMRARAAVEARRRETLESLHRRVSELARAVSVRAGAADTRERLAAAYLVPAGRVEAVERIVEAFAEAEDGLTVVCTGPWPPFSFVEERA